MFANTRTAKYIRCWKRNMRNKFYGKSKNKLNNTCVTVDGIGFQSLREADRYMELKLLLRAGRISNLELQKKYELIPAQYEIVETGEFYKVGEMKGQPKTKRVCVEQSVDYYADFVYEEDGKTIVEDVKGFQDPSSSTYAKFVIKRKLMLWIHGIRIREV